MYMKLFFRPDNRYLFTPDLGTDKVMIYQFNPLAKKPLKPFTPAYAAGKTRKRPKTHHFSSQ